MFHIDPEKLDDELWCKLYAEYLYINKVNHINMKAAVIAAFYDILSHVNDNNAMDTRVDR